ncbi:DNA adenine methylase [Maritalea porphyrae]|uniref:DNA adenine methylase n=1 Tax=Maritalea porphyrae TaxID=880732 RepID=UPI0022AEF81E|nr:DNA adenine methylase [Maritalea porphyrae]MCZ4272476.1 DNA adenine methylase [Maritalea porphyrae]
MNSQFTPVRPVSTPAPYMGGKRALAPKIVERINRVPHKLYVEVFVGMGGVFFKRNNQPQAEVINDKSGEVVNLFRILQRHYVPFMDYLRYQLTSRKEFERLVSVIPTTLTDLERAARFLYLQRTSYGGKVTGQSFGVAPERPARFDVSKLGPALEEIFERLSGVVIENLDWSVVMERYDRADALFYLDPPYWGCEDDYGKEVFSREDFALIADKMKTMQGRAILSLNDTPGVRETFAGLNMETFELQYMIGQASGGPKEVTEVLIYNFDLPDEGLFSLLGT